MAIDGINGLSSIIPKPLDIGSVQDSESNGMGFADFLKDALNKVNETQVQSDQIIEDFMTGKTDNLHEVMIAGEKADVTLQFAMQIRTKLLDAYNEIMRIQV